MRTLWDVRLWARLRALVSSLQIPLLTTLGFAWSAITDRGTDMALTMLHRGCHAIRELDTLTLIRDPAAT
jgi:hypothetical protein